MRECLSPFRPTLAKDRGTIASSDNGYVYRDHRQPNIYMFTGIPVSVLRLSSGASGPPLNCHTTTLQRSLLE